MGISGPRSFGKDTTREWRQHQEQRQRLSTRLPVLCPFPAFKQDWTMQRSQLVDGQGSNTDSASKHASSHQHHNTAILHLKPSSTHL